MYSSTEVDSPSEGGGVGTVYKQEDCSRPGVLNGSFFFFFFFFSFCSVYANAVLRAISAGIQYTVPTFLFFLLFSYNNNNNIV